MVMLVALLVATSASAVRATSLPVVIEKLNPAAIACGISAPQLESAALHTLETSQFQPDAEAGGGLNVGVEVTQTGRSPCAARISVQMKASPKLLPAAATANPKQRSSVPVVMLCNESGNYSASKDRFPLEVESAVEYSIRRCLGSLGY